MLSYGNFLLFLAICNIMMKNRQERCAGRAVLCRENGKEEKGMGQHIIPVFAQDEIAESMQCFSPMLGIEDRADFMVQPRTLDEFILIYVTRGVFFCELADRSYQVAAGKYIFIDLRVPHSYGFRKEIPSEICWMHLQGRQVGQIAAMIERLSPLPLIGEDPAVLDAIRTAHTMHTTIDINAFIRAKHLADTLLYLLEQVYCSRIGKDISEDEHRFRRSFEHILQAEDGMELPLDAICERMCMSKYYFSHRFRQYYGVSPMRYITEKRIQKAKRLLRVSNLKISAIAAECGFSAPEYFSKVFRRECGMTPEKFRQTGN